MNRAEEKMVAVRWDKDPTIVCLRLGDENGPALGSFEVKNPADADRAVRAINKALEFDRERIRYLIHKFIADLLSPPSPKKEAE